ncbi:hypothetical protein SLS62_008940 [Diatrype stigma]|uniref:Uncharacterized protein n=1 Tax=Diatrype stigma TaxID=117547 RepID=A0AAN9YM40_9PEZI
MAEVAGLVVGAIGLMGIVGAFKDVIDLYSIFTDSRNLGRDYEILEAKLDIEKALLLQWADRMKLLEQNYDRRLDDSNAQKLIMKILTSIAVLLTDLSGLQDRYGLDEVPVFDHTTSIGSSNDSRLQRISTAPFNKFISDFHALSMNIATRQQTTPLRKKVRWVIRDKQKFEGLVHELAHFSSKLNDVVPVVQDYEYLHFMAKRDLGSISDLRTLKILLDASRGSHRTILEAVQSTITHTCQRRILNSLWFRKIDDRRESISEAHCKTLQWALKPPETPASWDDLSVWLQSSSGIYWLSGKAGSGKSTLMKYLCIHHRTTELLSQWAQGNRCTMLSYFFANLGTVEQKSQEGLSRTLLYQILSENQGLISEALPNIWKELHDSDKDAISLPSASETHYAFQVLTRKASNGMRKYCFFIDGLDELAGDIMMSITFIKTLASSDNVKIIVASRPIPSCFAAFQDVPKLELQGLTRSDIASYVRDVVGGDPYMKRLIGRYPTESNEIIFDIVKKSAGVFLWVILACRALKSGFADRDRLKELRRRVDELPPELEDMFQHMLAKIELRHRQEGSRLLQICYGNGLAAQQGDGGWIYALGLALVDDDYLSMDQACLLPLASGDKRELCEELDGRLRSRCGGLLELAKPKPDSSTHHCICGETPHDPWVDSKVVFMHQTVFEFLCNENAWNIPALRTSTDDGFNLSAALAFHSLHLGTQCLYLDPPQIIPAFVDFCRGLQYGLKCDEQRPGHHGNFFENLQPFFDALGRIRRNHSSFDLISDTSPHYTTHNIELGSYLTLFIGIEAGAVNYVANHALLRAAATHDWKACGCLPILVHAIVKRILNKEFPQLLYRGNPVRLFKRSMAELLLSKGCNPNERLVVEGYKFTTPWLIWLEKYKDRTSPHGCDSEGRPSLDENLEILGVAESFLTSGAEPLPDQYCLVAWVERAFIRDQESDLVKDKAQAIVQLVRHLSGEEHIPVACIPCMTAIKRGSSARTTGSHLEIELREAKHATTPKETPGIPDLVRKRNAVVAPTAAKRIKMVQSLPLKRRSDDSITAEISQVYTTYSS